MLSNGDLERLIAEKKCQIEKEKIVLGLSAPADACHLQDIEQESQSARIQNGGDANTPRVQKSVRIVSDTLSDNVLKTAQGETETEIPAELERYIRRYLGLPMMLKAGEYSPNNPLVRGERGAGGDVLLGLGEYERRRNTLRKLRQQQYREYLDEQAKKKQEAKEAAERERREQEEKERRREEELNRARQQIEQQNLEEEQRRCKQILQDREEERERARKNKEQKNIEEERRASLCYLPTLSSNENATDSFRTKVDTAVQAGAGRALSVAVQTDDNEFYRKNPTPKLLLTQAERELSPRTVVDLDNRLIHSEDRHTHPDNRPIQPDNRSVCLDNRPVHPDNRHIYPDNRPLQPDNRQIHPDNRPSHSDNRSLQPDSRPLHHDNRSLYPDNRQLNPDNRSVHPDNRPLHPDNRPVYPDNKDTHPDIRHHNHPNMNSENRYQDSGTYNDDRCINEDDKRVRPAYEDDRCIRPRDTHPDIRHHNYPNKNSDNRYDDSGTYNDDRCINEDDRRIRPAYEDGRRIRPAYEDDRRKGPTYEDDRSIKLAYEDDRRIRPTCTLGEGQSARRRSYGDYDERSSVPSPRARLLSVPRHTHAPSIFDPDAIQTRNERAEKEAAERKQFYQQELRNQILEQQRIREERKTREKLLEAAEMRRLEEQLRGLRGLRGARAGEGRRRAALGAQMKESSIEFERKRTTLQNEIDLEQQNLFRAQTQPFRKPSTSQSDTNLKLPAFLPREKRLPFSTNISENSIFNPNYDVDSYLRKNLNPKTTYSSKLDLPETYERNVVVEKALVHDRPKERPRLDLKEKPKYEPSFKQNLDEIQDETPIPVLRHSPKICNTNVEEDIASSDGMKLVEDKWKVPAVQKNILKSLPKEDGKSVSILTQLGSIRRQLQLEQLRLDNMMSKSD